MYRPLAEERPQLRSALSQEIVALELELCSLSPHVVALERLLARKADLEKRLAWLRDMELSCER